MTAPPDPEPLAEEGDDSGDRCRLRLAGWEGPLALLLDQVRAQRIDLTQLSAAALVAQLEARLLAAIAARTTALPQLAGWVVAAATLLDLRARLVVPTAPAEDAAAVRDAAAMRRLLLEREAMRRAATWLEQRQQLGRDVFARGAPEPLAEAPPATDLTALLRACLTLLAAPARGVPIHRPGLPPLWRVPEALAHLRGLLPELARGGASLVQLVPAREGAMATPLQRRAVLASTLLAALELSRDGTLALDQPEAFGPIRVERGGSADAAPADAAEIGTADEGCRGAPPGRAGAGG